MYISYIFSKLKQKKAINTKTNRYKWRTRLLFSEDLKPVPLPLKPQSQTKSLKNDISIYKVEHPDLSEGACHV